MGLFSTEEQPAFSQGIETEVWIVASYYQNLKFNTSPPLFLLYFICFPHFPPSFIYLSPCFPQEFPLIPSTFPLIYLDCHFIIHHLLSSNFIYIYCIFPGIWEGEIIDTISVILLRHLYFYKPNFLFCSFLICSVNCF